MAEADVKKELQVLFKAKYAAVAIETAEEKRVESVVATAAAELAGKDPKSGEPLERPEVIAWSCTQGFTDLGGQSVEAKTGFGEAMEYIRNYPKRAIFVLRDAHPFLFEAGPQRQFRDTVRVVKRAPAPSAKMMVLVSAVFQHPATHAVGLPKEIVGDVHRLEWELPSREELGQIVQQVIDKAPASVQESFKKLDVEVVANAAIGLTSEAALGTLVRSLVAHQALVPEVIAREKKELIKEIGCLEWLEPDLLGLDGIGGWENTKAWFALRRQAFTPEARAYGLDPQKGVLLFGRPGTGKTALAKCLSHEWDMPAIRLNVAGIFGSLLGETEQRWRAVRRLMRTIGRALLFIDELDKAFGDGDQDGGTAKRFKGEFLTWLQDRDGSEVYVIATANDIMTLEATTPEMLRKGRWDEMFYVPLPHALEREAIFSVHMKRRNKNPKKPVFRPDIDVAALAQASEHFSGAEIEAAVASAMLRGFNDKMRQVATADVLAVLAGIKPQGKSSQRGKEVEKWANEHGAQWASGVRNDAAAVEKMVGKLDAPKPDDERLMEL